MANKQEPFEFESSEDILFADDNFQVYELRSAESFNLKQLEGKKNVLTNLIIKTNKPRIGMISGAEDSNIFISIVNMPIMITDETQIKVNIYNNSYFKGISVQKGDILGTLTIG